MEEDLIKCPECGSTQIHSDKKGFSAGKAVAGTLVGGVLVGAATGAVGKNKIILTCLKCGKTFKPGEQNSQSKLIERPILSTSDKPKLYKCRGCNKISSMNSASYCPKCGYKLLESDIFTNTSNNGGCAASFIGIIVVITASLIFIL